MFRISGDRGSLPLAMLLTVVGVGLTGLIGSTVLGQISTTRSDGDRAAATDAAQSGIETGLAQLRGLPVNATGDAPLSSLPCAGTSGPDVTLTGAVSAATGARYAVNVYYLVAAPPADSDAQTWAQGKRLGCAVTGGPTTAPMYALLAATGASGTETRTITATYLFQSHTKANVPGGTIKIYNTADCLAAPTDITGTTPPAG